MAEKKRSLGGTLLILGLVVLFWFARSKGWLPESEPQADGDGGVATAPAEAGPADVGPAEAEAEGGGAGAEEIARAARSQRSGFMVTTKGVVKKSLRDDNEGHRHQRFIVRLPNDHTVLVAHNIDLAPRVPLDEGDAVEIHGQYEWNEQGGVLHWTHHDPQKRHEEGWIRHGGELYE